MKTTAVKKVKKRATKKNGIKPPKPGSWAAVLKGAEYIKRVGLTYP